MNENRPRNAGRLKNYRKGLDSQFVVCSYRRRLIETALSYSKRYLLVFVLFPKSTGPGPPCPPRPPQDRGHFLRRIVAIPAGGVRYRRVAVADGVD
jgi:hypothetical protein